MDIMEFKYKYMQKVEEKPKKKILTIDEVQRVDSWAYNIFGSSEYAFMFDILIPNIEFALNHGYEIADL